MHASCRQTGVTGQGPETLLGRPSPVFATTGQRFSGKRDAGSRVRAGQAASTEETRLRGTWQPRQT